MADRSLLPAKRGLFPGDWLVTPWSFSCGIGGLSSFSTLPDRRARPAHRRERPTANGGHAIQRDVVVRKRAISRLDGNAGFCPSGFGQLTCFCGTLRSSGLAASNLNPTAKPADLALIVEFGC